MKRHPFRRSVRPTALPFLLLAFLLVLPAAAAEPPAAPGVAFSLSADSAVSEKARKTWDFWAQAQSDPALAAEFAKPPDEDEEGDHPSHFIRPTPYLALRIDPAEPHPSLAAADTADTLSCRFDFYFAPTNALPGLDPNAPVFAERACFHTEIATLPGGLPATVLLPPCIAGEDFLLPAFGKKRYDDRLIVRVTLQAMLHPGMDAVPLAETVLPPFSNSGRAEILASTNLPAEIWQSANDSWRPWTPAVYSATVPDTFPARFPHTAVLSGDDFAGLAARPVLARRLAPSACPVLAHDVRSPRPPADPPLPDKSILFPAPSTSAKMVGKPDTSFFDHDELDTFLVRPAAVRRAFPVYAAWSVLAFFLAAAAGIALLIAVFRRAPARRTVLWIAFPSAALALALLFLLAGALFLPRTPSADRILLRVGYAGSPEEWCRASIRCFAFRRTDWGFAFPSAEAGVAARGDLPRPARCTPFRDPGRDETRLDFPGGVPSTAFTVEGTWFAPADFPLQVRPPAEPPPEGAPEGDYREIAVNRDLDDLWVVVNTNRYHIGPVAAGSVVHPRPFQLATTNDILPDLPAPFDNRLPSITGGCGCPGKTEAEPDPETVAAIAAATEVLAAGSDEPASDALASAVRTAAGSWSSLRGPWLTIARAPSIAPWPSGPRIEPATRSTEQTLWITEWP